MERHMKSVTVSPFYITVRTSTHCTRYTALAVSSIDAWANAADAFGVCAITVIAARPA
jgi:hypothetical protein